MRTLYCYCFLTFVASRYLVNPIVQTAGEIVLEPRLLSPSPLADVPAWTNRVPWTFFALALFLVPAAIYVVQAAFWVCLDECVMRA